MSKNLFLVGKSEDNNLVTKGHFAITKICRRINEENLANSSNFHHSLLPNSEYSRENSRIYWAIMRKMKNARGPLSFHQDDWNRKFLWNSCIHLDENTWEGFQFGEFNRKFVEANEKLSTADLSRSRLLETDVFR